MSIYRDDLYTIRWYVKKYLEEIDLRDDPLMKGSSVLRSFDPKAHFQELKSLLDDIIDGKDTAKEPQRMDQIQFPSYVDLSSQIKIKTRGPYKTPSGAPKGLIVHFTAGRPNAPATLEYLASRGLGCLVMDEDGVIYSAQEPFQVAYHAGKSRHPDSLQEGMSFYCMGMEICNAGKLIEKNGKYYAWWDKSFLSPYSEDQIRIVEEAIGNVFPGVYHKYTEAQEKALEAFCHQQIIENEEFDIDWVLGHDEVAIPKGRKTDPGGSFSMTMPEFRESLRIFKSSL